jgi:two-component system, probable response regulator PhcQ
MAPPNEPQPFAILYVDDEEKSLQSFTRAFGNQFRILTATSAAEGLELLRQHRDTLAVLMTDQRMPGEKGVWLLDQARRESPQTLRILVTAYADIEATVQAVNSGAIYKYVHKPWDPHTLEILLRRAIDFYAVQRERDQLVREKMSILRNLMIADRLLSLGLLAAGLSHHIRNALVSVKTFLDLVPSKLQGEGLSLDQLRQPDFWIEYLDGVQGQIGRINNLLRDLWLASEKPAFEFKDTVSLHDVVDMTFLRLRARFHENRLAVENQIPRDLPLLTVDHKRFARLFELLLEDELVSLPPGSTITLRAAPDTLEPDHPALRVEIHDNGPGLPQEALRLLFDPFLVRSDSPSEYGIRLMACFFIVHQHGGKIVAHSSPQHGTTFILKLPLNPANLTFAEENQRFLEKLFFSEEQLDQQPPPSPSAARS